MSNAPLIITKTGMENCLNELKNSKNIQFKSYMDMLLAFVMKLAVIWHVMMPNIAKALKTS